MMNSTSTKTPSYTPIEEINNNFNCAPFICKNHTDNYKFKKRIILEKIMFNNILAFREAVRSHDFGIPNKYNEVFYQYADCMTQKIDGPELGPYEYVVNDMYATNIGPNGNIINEYKPWRDAWKLYIKQRKKPYIKQKKLIKLKKNGFVAERSRHLLIDENV